LFLNCPLLDKDGLTFTLKPGKSHPAPQGNRAVTSVTPVPVNFLTSPREFSIASRKQKYETFSAEKDCL